MNSLLLTTLDTGNTAWMIMATILVLLMSIPGIALFYGGLVRQKNILSILMQTVFIVAVVSLIWVAFGYSWAFSTEYEDSGNPLACIIGGFDKCFLHGIQHRGGGALAGPHQALALSHGARENKRGGALFGGQVGVARAFRQTVFLAHDGAAHNLHVHVQVTHHATDDGQLLGVLLAEVGAVGLGDVHQLVNNGAHAAEVRWARLAA